MEIHICSITEYNNETRVPTIVNPNSSTFYLVPTEDGTSPDLFTEWVYVNGAWEMFGNTSMDLSGYLTDVQINGQSIVTDGVANVPTASASRLGVVKTSNANGIYVNSDGALSIIEASSANVKTGTNVYKPITPHIEHEAAFYGLAKAAGDTTQSQSSNAVGEYTEDAKRAIREMFGLPRYTEAETIADMTTEEDKTSIAISTDVNGLAYELRTAKIIVILPASTTGTADFISARFNAYNAETGNIESLPLPTQRMNSKDASVNIYTINTDGRMLEVTACNAAWTGASTGQVISFSHTIFAERIYKIHILQYNSSSTLIPAGTRIIIQGIRA